MRIRTLHHPLMLNVTGVSLKKRSKKLEKKLSHVYINYSLYKGLWNVKISTNNMTPIIQQQNNQQQNSQPHFDTSLLEVDKAKNKVNLTKMAEHFNKSVKEWFKNKSTKQFIDALIYADGRIPPIEIIKGGNEEQGTWGTREVALRFAQWLNPHFGVFCIKKLDELFQTGSTSLKPKMEQSNNNLDNYLDSSEEDRAIAFFKAQKKNKQLQLNAEEAQPKLEVYHQLAARDGLLNIRDTAKEIGMKQNDFVQFLLDNSYLYRDQKGQLRPYSVSVEKGWFTLKEYASQNHSGTQTLITFSGRDHLVTKLKTNGNILLYNQINN